MWHAHQLVLGVAALVHSPVAVLDVGGWDLDLNVMAGAGAFDVLTDYAMFGSV